MGHAEVINGTHGVRSEFFIFLTLTLTRSLGPWSGYYESAACMDALTLFVNERERVFFSGWRCRLLRLSQGIVGESERKWRLKMENKIARTEGE